MSWGENKVSTLDIAQYGSVEKSLEKLNEKIKITTISMSCFSMRGNYVCPYYGQFTDEAKEHCHKCWNI